MKKLTITRLAWKNLRRGKKQYLIMAVSILLSMIFSSGILFFLASVRASRTEANLRAVGKQDCIVPDPSADMLARMRADPDIGNIGLISVLGWADTGDKEKGTAIASMDEPALALWYPQLAEGRLPEKAGEIAIEADALNRLRITASVGEQITLQVYPADGAMFLEEPQPQTYTLVGVLENRRKTLEYLTNQTVAHTPFDAPAENRIPAAFVSREEGILPSGKAGQFLLFTDAREAKKDVPFGTYFREKYDLSTVIYTEAVYSLSLTVLEKKIDGFLVVGLVLLAASALGIAGAFQANLSEKKRQIGMLRAVGATRRQILQLYFREALLLTLATLLPSLLISFCGTRALISLTDPKAVFIPDYKTLILASLFSLLCVFLSALLPLVGVMRTPPMAAVRSTEQLYRLRRKKIKSKMRFNPSQLMSSRRTVFSPFKKRTSVFLLALAIVISCFGSYTITDIHERYQDRAHDFEIVGKESAPTMINYGFWDGSLTESDKMMLSEFRGVKSMHGTKVVSVLQHMERYGAYYDLLSLFQSVRYSQKTGSAATYEEFKKLFYVNPAYNETRSTLGIRDELWQANLNAVDDETLEALSSKVVEGKLDLEKINDGSEILLFCSPRVGLAMQFSESGYGMNFLSLTGRESALELKNVAETVECPIHAGDKLLLSTIKSNISFDRYMELINGGGQAVPDDLQIADREVTVGAILSDSSWGGQYTFYTSLSAFGLFGGDGNYDAFSVDMNAPVTEESETEYQNWINGVFGARSVRVISRGEERRRMEDEEQNAISIVLSVMIISTALLTVLIGNSLTAQIRADKRMIGTLRAVGADSRTVGGIYYRQLIGVMLRGSVFGYGITLLIQGAYYLIKILRPSLELIRGGLRAEYWQAGLLVAVILLLCFIRVWNAVRREQKHSIVENIREL